MYHIYTSAEFNYDSVDALVPFEAALATSENVRGRGTNLYSVARIVLQRAVMSDRELYFRARGGHPGLVAIFFSFSSLFFPTGLDILDASSRARGTRVANFKSARIRDE